MITLVNSVNYVNSVNEKDASIAASKAPCFWPSKN